MVGGRKDLEPLAIYLVSKGTKGDRLLFKYPYDGASDGPPSGSRVLHSPVSRRLNPYALRQEAGPSSQELFQEPPPASLVSDSRVTGLSDDLLSYLFTVKAELCSRRFELQVKDVKFLGYPLETPRDSRASVQAREKAEAAGEEGEEAGEGPVDEADILVYAVVFAVRSSAPGAVVSLYQELSKRLGLALRHEEARCGFLSAAARPLIAALDEASSRDDGVSPYPAFARAFPLPALLKQVFQDVAERGFTSVHVNNWIEVSFAIPQKLYAKLQLPSSSEVERTLTQLSFRPYHALLLLEDASDVLAALPLDSSPALVRLLTHLSPLKSLEATAADLDLPISQLSLLARHLVNWGKAIFVFPLCERNLYAVVPELNLCSSQLCEAFGDRFPHTGLHSVLAEFSPQLSVGEFLGAGATEEQRLPLLVWLLQRQVLVQLHTFVYLVPPAPSPACEGTALEEEDEEDEGLSCDAGGAEWRAEVETTLVGLRAAGLGEELLAEVRRRTTGAVPSGALLEDLSLLGRLGPLCDGSLHLEELMYSLNVSRAQLLRCLDRFASIVVPHLRPDSNLHFHFSRENDACAP